MQVYQNAKEVGELVKLPPDKEFRLAVALGGNGRVVYIENEDPKYPDFLILV